MPSDLRLIALSLAARLAAPVDITRLGLADGAFDAQRPSGPPLGR